MRSALQEALDHLGRVIVETFQAPPARIKIYLREGDEPVLNVALAPSLYLNLPTSTPPGGPNQVSKEEEEPAESDQDHRHSRCSDDILEVLNAAKIPMTTTILMSALSKAKREWSQRYVEKRLAQMVKDGTLENPEGVRPRGYRIPSWEST